MRRLLCIICVFVLAMYCVATAGADVIFEPQDSFYESHRDECERHERSYTAKGPNGDVTVYKSPESDRVQTVIGNGEKVYISYVYTDADGNNWGYYENWETGVSGWMPMAYLELIYDEISFREEFGHLLVEETGSLAAEHKGKTVKFWSYPGSTGYIEVPFESDYAPEYQTVYTDANGVRWGRVGYYMAIRGHWINLDDPDGDVSLDVQIPEETQVPTQAQEQTDPVEEIVPQPSKDNTVVLIVTGAVAAVVAATAVLLIVLKRKK